jgi:hypothetical protein
MKRRCSAFRDKIAINSTLATVIGIEYLWCQIEQIRKKNKKLFNVNQSHRKEDQCDAFGDEREED